MGDPKPCHNCRRLRLRCDQSIPSCIKCTNAGRSCLGYGTLIQWNKGVASRGKMMGKTFDIPSRAGLPPASSHSHVSYQFVLNSRSYTSITSTGKPTIPRQAIDPLFQDFSPMSRYYIHHFANSLCSELVSHDVVSHNPYRNLIPMAKDHELLLHVIIANSAIHLWNTSVPPLKSVRSSSVGTSRQKCRRLGNSNSSRVLQDALAAKQRTIELIRHSLDHIDTADKDILLASILLSINFELVNSGKDDWRVHVEGAKRLIDVFGLSAASSNPTLSLLHDYVVSDCLIYYILGSAFSSYESSKQILHYPIDVLPMLERAEANSYLSCPAVLLQILLEASRLSSRSIPELEEHQSRYDEAKKAFHLLEVASSFDVYSWAKCVQGVSTHGDFKSRTHVALAHQSAVCLYIHRAVPFAGLLNEEGIKILVNTIIDNLSSIPAGDQLLKGTSWPTFIAGAESTNHTQQAWSIEHLHGLWQVLPWGYVHTAIEMLETIWDDRSSPNDPTANATGWLQTLKLLGNDWIVV